MIDSPTPYQPLKTREEYYDKYSNNDIQLFFRIRKDKLDPAELKVDAARYNEYLLDYSNLFSDFMSQHNYSGSKRSTSLTPQYNQVLSQASNKPSSSNLLGEDDRPNRKSTFS